MIYMSVTWRTMPNIMPMALNAIHLCHALSFSDYGRIKSGRESNAVADSVVQATLI
jgi:hypothetical protein